MVASIDTAVVRLWGESVGAVSWLDDLGYALFEYEPRFLQRGLEVAPLHMPLAQARLGGNFSFPNLAFETYLGLPGMLADALPDKFGTGLIEAWLARQGRDPSSFNPVEKLCYMSQRSMGALEFFPAINGADNASVPVEVPAMVSWLQEMILDRDQWSVDLFGTEKENGEALLDILRVGTSAGGMRPKAVIAMNDAGNALSGQGDVPEGFDYWLLKFDGVSDKSLHDPKGFGRIEYAYYKMAIAAGITMMPCRLLEENGRAHFMTKRFDRKNGQKIHMQSLCGIAHFDYNLAGIYSYEQVFAIMRQLRLPKEDALAQYRRMLFNIMACNRDDHTKNISFLMTEDGQWRLSPAYDMTYAYNPAGQWTHQHQMSAGGSCAKWSKDTLMQIGDSIGIANPEHVFDEIRAAIDTWPQLAKDAGVNQKIAVEIARSHARVFTT